VKPTKHRETFCKRESDTEHTAQPTKLGTFNTDNIRACMMTRINTTQRSVTAVISLTEPLRKNASKSNSKDIVIECKRYLGFRDVDELITQRKRAFLAAFNANDSSIICNAVICNTSLIAFSTNTVI